MDIDDRRPAEFLEKHTNLPPSFFLFVAIPTLLGAAHHLDHVVRGNHVGWPLTGQVTPFTYSLAIYPLLVVSLYLTVTDRVEARYWAGFFAISAAVVAFVHLGPWAVEPPRAVVGPYADPAVGYLAFGVLLALVASASVGAAYSAVLWTRGES